MLSDDGRPENERLLVAIGRLTREVIYIKQVLIGIAIVGAFLFGLSNW